MSDSHNVKADPRSPVFAHYPFDLTSNHDAGIQLGLVTLEADLTIESELRHFIGDATSPNISKSPTILHSRIACDDLVTAQNLTAMKGQFTQALGLFPTAHHFDVVGYGCTSASLLIGEDVVQSIIKAHIDVDHVTTPLTGARRALAALQAKHIGYLAPYVSEISEKMCQLLKADGLCIDAAGTFGEGRDSIVGRIDPQSILQALTALAKRSSTPLDAIFVSCTSLKCAPIIEIAEAQLGIPVISSNSAIAWDMARLSGLAVPASGKGRLFQQN